MRNPPNAEVLNAIVQPALDVLRQVIGLQGTLGKMSIVTEIEAPQLCARIDIRGTLAGPVIWSFEPTVARELVARMLGTAEVLSVDGVDCFDAIAELANILVGHATGALSEAGYLVELKVPSTSIIQNPEKLDERGIKIKVHTDAGEMNLVIALRLVDQGEALPPVLRLPLPKTRPKGT